MSQDKLKQAAQVKPPQKKTKSVGADLSYKDWPKELGGPKGPEPTRYGDWEQNGRCSDF